LYQTIFVYEKLFFIKMSNCVVKECQSRKEATGDDLEQGKYICRYEQFSVSKNCLSKEAVPTLFSCPNGEDESTTVDSSEPSSDPGKPKKRGTAGILNLQKARMKRLLRKERMKNAGRRPKPKLKLEPNSSNERKINPEKDFFLSNRELTPGEKLVIPLRLTTLVKQLYDGSNLCKEPPISTKDTKTFPIFNIIRRINGISNTNNPLEWSPQDTFHFVKQISPAKGIAKVFFAEEIDGEALLNLNTIDITTYLGIDSEISEELAEKFSQLRKEVIHRFINT
jgi:hypothetical protein